MHFFPRSNTEFVASRHMVGCFSFLMQRIVTVVRGECLGQSETGVEDYLISVEQESSLCQLP